MIRAMFLDLDGTLVGRANTISPQVRTAIGRARERGCEVVLCTGRSRVSAEPVTEQLGFRPYAVLSNGAVVMDFATREVLCRNVIPIPAALRVVREMRRAGLEPQVYEDAIHSARILHHPHDQVALHSPERQRAWPSLEEELPFEPICVSAYGPEALLRPAAERLAANPVPGTFVEQAGTHAVWCVEVHHLQSGKCNGLQLVAERLEVRRNEVLAIGDHFNDLTMIRWAGVGVAMGNALPEVQAAADYVTTSLAEDGVARAIERFVLT